MLHGESEYGVAERGRRRQCTCRTNVRGTVSHMCLSTSAIDLRRNQRDMSMTMPPTNRQAQKAKKPPAGRNDNMTMSLCSLLHDLLQPGISSHCRLTLVGHERLILAERGRRGQCKCRTNVRGGFGRCAQPEHGFDWRVGTRARSKRRREGSGSAVVRRNPDAAYIHLGAGLAQKAVGLDWVERDVVRSRSKNAFRCKVELSACALTFVATT